MRTPRARAGAPKLDAAVAQTVPPMTAPAATAPTEVREPVRQALRPVIPGRAVAYNRAGQPIQRAGAETGVDEFAIPPHLPPPGWSWEWKVESVLGATDHGVQAKQAAVGWEPVMMESYPGVFAPEYNDKGEINKGPVRRKGLMLKERPMVLTIEAQADEKRKADERVHGAKNQYRRLNTQGAQTAEIDETAERMSYIRQNTEQVVMPTPGPNGRQPVD